MLWFIISKTNRQGRNTKAITKTWKSVKCCRSCDGLNIVAKVHGVKVLILPTYKLLLIPCLELLLAGVQLHCGENTLYDAHDMHNRHSIFQTH